MDEIRSICGVNNLILIEDCAHSLGAEFNGQKVGAFNRAAFFSFSRDKIISSVYGGMATTNDPLIAKKLEELQKEFGQPSNFWIFQQLLHPILLNYLILPIYNFLDLGKIFLVLSQWFHILSKAVSWQEKRGQRPDYFPRALPNALAAMALNQFNKLEKFNHHRQKIANYYFENLNDPQAGTPKFELPKKFENRKNVFLRFTIKHSKVHEIIYNAWHKQNILLGDWYTTPIAPFDTKIEEMKYTLGTCKNAEELAKKTLNLPTHINISQKDAERIVKFLKNYE
jgi:dTDP-4-amino-4,6-dideoxygalactose transaminase